MGQKFVRAPRASQGREHSLLPKFNTLPTNIFLGWCWRAAVREGLAESPALQRLGEGLVGAAEELVVSDQDPGGERGRVRGQPAQGPL